MSDLEQRRAEEVASLQALAERAAEWLEARTAGVGVLEAEEALREAQRESRRCERRRRKAERRASE